MLTALQPDEGWAMFIRCLAFLVSVSAAFAAPVPKSLKAPSKWDTARFKLNYSRAPFERLLEDFAKESGLEWVGDRPPLGTVTLRPKKEYTAVECLDLINEVLEKDNVILVRHGKTFYLLSGGQSVAPETVDEVTTEEIKPAPKPIKRPAPGWGGGEEQWVGGEWVPVEQAAKEERQRSKRGRTEIATLALELPANLKFEDVRIQITKTLSPIGRVDVSERGEIRVTDRVNNLWTISRVLEGPITEK